MTAKNDILTEKITHLEQQIEPLQKQLSAFIAERNALVDIHNASRLAEYGLEKNKIIIVNKAIKDWFFKDTETSRYQRWINKPFMLGVEAIISSSISSDNTVRLRSDGWGTSFPIDMIVQATKISKE